MDDCSDDETYKAACTYKKELNHLNINILRNPETQGYGGNQKIGFHYAIKNQFEILVVLPPDGKYFPTNIQTKINGGFMNGHLVHLSPLSTCTPHSSLQGKRIYNEKYHA